MSKKMDLVADVSSYQLDTVDYFKSLRDLGVKAVIIKVTQGSRYGDCYLNSKAKAQVASARKSGDKKLDVYSMASWFWSERIHPYALKPQMNLWVANYTTAGKPGLDRVGTWQFTDRFKGMNLDMSYDFKGWYTE